MQSEIGTILGAGWRGTRLTLATVRFLLSFRADMIYMHLHEKFA
jgi:hypothetical protein